MVVFALDRINLAALIKPENLIAQIKSVSKKAQPFVDAVTSLHIELCMRVKINVATGALQPQNRVVRRPVRLVRKLKQVGIIVSNRKPPGKSRLVISQPDVPVVRCLPL